MPVALPPPSYAPTLRPSASNRWAVRASNLMPNVSPTRAEQVAVSTATRRSSWANDKCT